MASDSADKTPVRYQCKACGKEFARACAVCPDDGTLLTPVADDPLIGTILAERYEILSLVGKGGMGVVYKGRHVLMDRVVAVKMLHSHLVAEAITLQRFQQEAKACSQLSHPNVVAVFDFGVNTSGQPYLVMDFLEGVSLSDELEAKGPLPAERALPIFMQICDGLGHAHQKGIIHRDLKPGNILLMATEETADFVKVVDFGIAKLLPGASKESMHLTKTGEVFGSPLYMSPEQCLAMEMDARSDIYTFGCVLYESLTGAPPFVGKHVLHTIQMHIDEKPKSFAEANSTVVVPPALEAIVARAMDKNPERRQQTMAEIKRELMAVAGTSGVAQGAVTVTSTHNERAGTKAPASPKPAGGKALGADKLRVALIAGGVALFALVLWLVPSPLMRFGLGQGPETAWDRHNQLYQEAMEHADYEAAEDNLDAAIEAGSQLAEPQLMAAHSLTDKGQLLIRLQRFDEAELSLEKALAIRRKGDSLDNPESLDGMRTLAHVYHLNHKYDFAAFQYKQLLELEKKMFGDDSLEAAKTLGSIGRVNLEQGRTGEALKHLKLAGDIIQKHPDTRDAELKDILKAYTDELGREGQSKTTPATAR